MSTEKVVKEKFNKISNEIDTINPMVTQMKEAIKLASRRLKQLHDAGFHIEAIILNGQIIEHTIKMTLRAYKAKRNILNILDRPDPLREVILTTYENDTLGNLIKLFAKFTGETELTKLLWAFKNDYRDEFIHNIFDGSKDIKQIEKEALDYTTGQNLQKIIIGLVTSHIKVQDEVHQLYS